MRTEARVQGNVRWTERDLTVLPWIFEQYVVRYDQLARLLARWPGKATKQPGRVVKETVRDRVYQWEKAEAVTHQTLLVGQMPWCWVIPRGQTLMGLVGRAWTPTIRGARGLEHRFHVNEVRLWLEQAHPDAIWTSERLLWQEQPPRSKGGKGLPVPDAEVQLAGRRIAIEVELHAKTEERWQEILTERAARYDQVWYFTPARLARDLGRAVEALAPADRAKYSLSQVNEAAYRLGR